MVLNSSIAPETSTHMEQRRHPRFQVDYTGSFSGEGINGNGIILDLSSSGCRARHKSTVDRGDSLGMLIDVPKYETPLHVDLAVVRWVQGQEFGTEFIRMAPAYQEQLREVTRLIGVNAMPGGNS